MWGADAGVAFDGAGGLALEYGGLDRDGFSGGGGMPAGFGDGDRDLGGFGLGRFREGAAAGLEGDGEDGEFMGEFAGGKSSYGEDAFGAGRFGAASSGLGGGFGDAGDAWGGRGDSFDGGSGLASMTPGISVDSAEMLRKPAWGDGEDVSGLRDDMVGADSAFSWRGDDVYAGGRAGDDDGDGAYPSGGWG